MAGLKAPKTNLISDEDRQFIDRYEKARDDAKLAQRNEGYSPENKRPKDKNPARQGVENPKQICQCCGETKTPNAFPRDYGYEGNKSPICTTCKTKYQKLSLSASVRSRTLEKAVHKEAKRVERERRANKISNKAYSERQKMAITELAQRKLAKDHLLPFIQRFNHNYSAGWVHKAICKRLERFSKDVVEKKSPRLMIFMPPRAGKSEIASKTFPAWHLGHNPEHEIIASSYAVSLPIGFSRKVKDLISSGSYKQVFPHTALSKTSQAAEAWLTTRGGGYVAAGVGTGITGKGAHIAIVDDPVKDAEEADSETQRQKVWDWYSSTLYTRLAPGGGVLVIQTRWHDDDLSGRLIRKQKESEQELTEEIERLEEELSEASSAKTKDSINRELAQARKTLEHMERWDILVFPQEATHDEYYQPQNDMFYNEPHPGATKIRSQGEPLHPDRFNERMIIRMKQTMEPRHWSALHQQNPVPEEGEIFTKGMFRFEPTVHDWRWSDVYIAGDLALGVKQSNDWSVLIAGAMDHNGQLHIIDLVRFKGGADPIIENTLALLRRYEKRLVKFGLEQGQIQMAIWPELLRQIKEARLGVSFAEGKDALKPVSDKVARARTAQAMMQQGRIIWPSNQPWLEDAQTELMRFPGGLHDDVVDALAWLAKLSYKATPPKQPGAPKKVKSWKDKLTFSSHGGGHLSA